VAAPWGERKWHFPSRGRKWAGPPAVPPFKWGIGAEGGGVSCGGRGGCPFGKAPSRSRQAGYQGRTNVMVLGRLPLRAEKAAEIVVAPGWRCSPIALWRHDLRGLYRLRGNRFSWRRTVDFAFHWVGGCFDGACGALRILVCSLSVHKGACFRPRGWAGLGILVRCGPFEICPRPAADPVSVHCGMHGPANSSAGTRPTLFHGAGKPIHSPSIPGGRHPHKE